MVPIDAAELIDVSELDNSITEEDLASKAQFKEEHSLLDTSMPDEKTSANEIRNSVSIHSIVAKPIVQCQETGQYVIIDNIKRSAIWADGYQTKALRLTSSETTALKTEIFNALAKHPSTAPYTWKIAGWHIYTNIYLDAQNPLRIEFRPTCSRQDTFKYQSETIISQYTSWETEYNFLTSAINNEYFFAGIEGNFYFKYPSGSEGGMLFYSIFVLDSDV